MAMRRSSTPSIATIVVGLILVAGCGSGGDESSSTTAGADRPSTTTEPTTTTDSTDEPGRDGSAAGCPDKAELEVVLGGPVELGSSSGTSMSFNLTRSVSYAHRSCDVELTGGGRGSVTVARVTSAQVDGEHLDGSVFPVLRDAAEAAFDEKGFEAIAEMGVEAYRDGREVVYLSGEVMVFVGVEVDGEESLEAAVDLVGALVAAEHVLSADGLDCRFLDGVAPSEFGPVASTSSSGRGSTVGEVTVEADGCGAVHASGTESSISVAPAEVWDGWVRAKTDSVFTSVFTEVVVAGRWAFDDGKRLVVDDGDQPLIVEASGDGFDPDPAAVRLAVAELVLAG